MQRVIIQLSLSTERVMEYYRGAARYVLTVAKDGRTVQFPASMLRQFVTEEGVHGSFEIVFDKNNKMKTMRRLHLGASLDKLV